MHGVYVMCKPNASTHLIIYGHTHTLSDNVPVFVCVTFDIAHVEKGIRTRLLHALAEFCLQVYSETTLVETANVIKITYEYKLADKLVDV